MRSRKERTWEQQTKLCQISADLLFLASNVTGIPSPSLKSTSFFYKTRLGEGRLPFPGFSSNELPNFVLAKDIPLGLGGSNPVVWDGMQTGIFLCSRLGVSLEFEANFHHGGGQWGPMLSLPEFPCLVVVGVMDPSSNK
ncbi:hypothetical protein NE237_023302 [Protea cynaroides]|uniref:Uncharacterized protein n=1 Tax=Protea cynaroides TaxID=273540 RepID=A0A9Q0K6I2_9MAGN|nr:hypothetical protein NE237_023302 [Protea cynaroides]